MAIAAVVIYFMIKDKYGLDNPLSYANYIFIALNIKSLIEIYVNVGFFMVQSLRKKLNFIGAGVKLKATRGLGYSLEESHD